MNDTEFLEGMVIVSRAAFENAIPPNCKMFMHPNLPLHCYALPYGPIVGVVMNEMFGMIQPTYIAEATPLVRKNDLALIIEMGSLLRSPPPNFSYDAVVQFCNRHAKMRGWPSWNEFYSNWLEERDYGPERTDGAEPVFGEHSDVHRGRPNRGSEESVAVCASPGLSGGETLGRGPDSDSSPAESDGSSTEVTQSHTWRGDM